MRGPEQALPAVQDAQPGVNSSLASYALTLSQNASQPWGAAFCGGPLSLAASVPDNVTVAAAGGAFNTFSNILCVAAGCSTWAWRASHRPAKGVHRPGMKSTGQACITTRACCTPAAHRGAEHLTLPAQLLHAGGWPGTLTAWQPARQTCSRRRLKHLSRHSP